MPDYEEVSMIVSEPQIEAPAIFPQNLSVATTFDSHGEYYNNAASVNQTAVCGQGDEGTDVAYTDCAAYNAVEVV